MSVVSVQRWEPSWEGVSRRDLRAGSFPTYVPDDLVARPLVLDGRLAAHAGAVEARVRALAAGPGARSLEARAGVAGWLEVFFDAVDVAVTQANAFAEQLEALTVEWSQQLSAQIERGTTGYLARDVFELLTIAERRLASTRWDTRQSAPSRPVSVLPQP